MWLLVGIYRDFFVPSNPIRYISTSVQSRLRLKTSTESETDVLMLLVRIRHPGFTVNDFTLRRWKTAEDGVASRVCYPPPSRVEKRGRERKRVRKREREERGCEREKERKEEGEEGRKKERKSFPTLATTYVSGKREKREAKERERERHVRAIPVRVASGIITPRCCLARWTLSTRTSKIRNGMYLRDYEMTEMILTSKEVVRLSSRWAKFETGCIYNGYRNDRNEF